MNTRVVLKKQTHNKTNIETIHEWCKQHNIKFLDEVYVNNKHKHHWLCNKHNEIHVAMWDKVKLKGNLKCCSYERKTKSKEERVDNFCKKYNLTLVGDYKDSQTPTKWKCNVHGEVHENTRHCMEHSRGKLPCCKAGKHGHTLEEVKAFAESKNWMFLDEKFLGVHHKHNWLCKKHNVINCTTYTILKRGSFLECCHHEQTSGPNHPQYNHNVPGEQRIKDRRSSINKKWRYSVVKRDNFTCQHCSKTINDAKLNAHHIYSYLDNPSLRYELSNGITFCVECHQEFHKRFGKSNNNLQQLMKFMFPEFVSDKHHHSHPL